MSARVRVSHIVVQPVLVIDEGDELSPGPEVRALTVPLAGLAGVADQLRAEVAKLTLQLQEELAQAANQEHSEG
jgi:hypothetical protein